VEKFLVVSGAAEVLLKDNDTGSTVLFTVSGDQPRVIDIPLNKTHWITNVGDKELVTLFWSSEPFDEQDPDTFRLEEA
jgi:UDP-2-acetamido-2,6-beta-L-arabino-hexul-4-ose reductase